MNKFEWYQAPKTNMNLKKVNHLPMIGVSLTILAGLIAAFAYAI